MKKARIILTAIAVFALIGGALAFKASRTFFHIYTSTNRVSTTINGVATTYTAIAGQFYCTTSPLFTTIPNVGALSTYATTLGAVTTTVPVGGGTFTIYSACPTTTGWVTTDN